MFSRVLVANRGEIARRIIRACRALGVETVAVFSDADADAPHVREADRAVRVGPPPAVRSYLHTDAILRAACETGCDAIHPGYGFLAEQAEFARRCVAAGVVFIGPPAEVIAAMGDKVRARRLMHQAGIPVVPGSLDYLPDDTERAVEAAAAVGFPVLIKAAGGGGGIGMVRVADLRELPAALEVAARRARQTFGNASLYVERLLDRPRHVEVQLLGDRYGRLVHLYERECSIQRRHQKILEESPSPALDEVTRATLTAAALRAGQAVGYHSAGTVEFLLDHDGRFYFLEMNTRIQVEHPVTEMRTGVDLVQLQIRLAAGEPLALAQEDIQPRGHALQCRVCAEDPVTFYPSPGSITGYQEPSGPHVRVDSGVELGTSVTPYYDSLLAKVVVWAPDRPAAIARMTQALRGYRIEGVLTNIPVHLRVLAHPEFAAGRYHTEFLASTAARSPA
ncbi:MAG: acetyl-CoA carboxylase biotin carboxylase subunit [Armatimonadota bacterium]|nr:acetyl-CoA carboxylase biotin carboxylase subunit [Armatimonadota bacterium]MDR7611753.1 acetyl-CoA carboxylase biotin carboxylase subunit [Armatimonadota bacterium]